VPKERRIVTAMAWRVSGRTTRVVALVLGLALAVAATSALVLTEDPQVLRLAVVAALWSFLVAAFVGGQNRSGEAAPPGAEVSPRHAQQLELEVASRREFELQTEVRLRREIEGVLREDLGALRGELDRLRRTTAV